MSAKMMFLQTFFLIFSNFYIFATSHAPIQIANAHYPSYLICLKLVVFFFNIFFKHIFVAWKNRISDYTNYGCYSQPG